MSLVCSSASSAVHCCGAVSARGRLTLQPIKMQIFFVLFTLSTNVVAKGAIDYLKWGREAKLGSELNSELKGACGKEGRQTASIGHLLNYQRFTIYGPFSVSAVCADGLKSSQRYFTDRQTLRHCRGIQQGELIHFPRSVMYYFQLL